jgi:hypothetical protein
MTKDQDLSFNEARDRNNKISTDQTKLRASLIRQKHCAIRLHLPAGSDFRQEQGNIGSGVCQNPGGAARLRCPQRQIFRNRRKEAVMGNCIVVVQFDLPKRTEDEAIKGGTSTAPIYRDLGKKGLIRKDYLNGAAGTGGVYLWDSRAAAEAWFTEERIAELTRRFGVRPRLTWYDTHVTVDNLKGETRVNGKSLAGTT